MNSLNSKIMDWVKQMDISSGKMFNTAMMATNLTIPKQMKICVVTSARSEYGLLKWLMHDIEESDRFELQLVVAGGHLLQSQGHTIDQIVEDGFQPDEVVDAHLDISSTETIAESMGRMAEQFAGVFARLSPDALCVLGDRYELLPICNSAYVMRIPIIHLCGGDVTEGAIDDGIRNAVTMLASWHFPATEKAARNIIRMRGSEENVWTVGEPGLDAFLREKLISREELAANLGLDPSRHWILMTYHPETRRTLQENLETLKNCIRVLMGNKAFCSTVSGRPTDSRLAQLGEKEIPYKALLQSQVLATYANADYGGEEINRTLEEAAKEFPERFYVIPSLGHLRYLSFMKQARMVIGNSSSGIVEAPFLGIPVVNIGDRQKGRHQCSNIVQSGTSEKDIAAAVKKALAVQVTVLSDERNCEDKTDRYYWGDGHTAERIIAVLEDIL